MVDMVDVQTISAETYMYQVFLDFGIRNSQFRGGFVGMKGLRLQEKCRQVHSPRRVPPGFNLSWVIDSHDSWWLILWVPKNMHCQKHHSARHQHPK